MPDPVDRNAKSLLDATVRAFEERISQLNFRHFSAMHFFKYQHNQVANLLEKYEDRGFGAENVGMGSCPSFSDIGAATAVLDLSNEEARIVPLKATVARGDGLLGNLNDALNDQLSWILVGLIEAHERFLKDLYAAIGYLESGLWPPKHLKSSSGGFCCLSRNRTPPSRDYEFYSSQARTIAQSNCSPILNQLRAVFPRFAQFEKTRWISSETDRFWRDVAELFRHLIVHQHGEEKDAKFWKSINKKTGRSVSGRKESVLRLRVAVYGFLKKDDDVVRIRLIKDNRVGAPANQSLVDGPFRRMFEAVLNHCFLAYREGISHFGEKPYWARHEDSGES